MSHFNFDSCKSIVCEPGAIARLGELSVNLGTLRVLLVTDRGLVDAGLHQSAVDSLTKAGVECLLYTDVVADPPESIVEDAIEFARDHNIDGVIGFGGGSSMDVAKLVAALFHTQLALEDAYGVGNIKGSRLPLIQIPTTAGTGSEVTPIAIITTGETTKAGVVSPQLLPDIALLDADLTLGLPPQVTAATGIDAMVHAIEAYTSAIKKNPYSDMLAKEALRLLSSNIETVVYDGQNRDARSAMLLGSLLAGQAFANAPVAAVHALAYPLGGHFHIPHGLSNSLVLPHVMRFNLPVAAPLYSELAEIIVKNDAGVAPDPTQRSLDLIHYIEQLIAKLELPNQLRAVQVPEQSLSGLARDAMQQQRLLVNNPRTVSEQDALQIYRAAY
ncbi:iron-containing alcohol dehydrogenase [uncultured Microbulbifer sp.]|uniref:iron-containing alcohol dehydrogenase n=1 Tax=uncultured Microbulbifer sp. TaxID=348147 RepID=UPI00263A2BBD|nr:iron-containing alcohol dehydrogenase [uncultured Microbulbifer sp.]